LTTLYGGRLISRSLDAAAKLAAFLRIRPFVRRLLPRRVQTWIFRKRTVVLVPTVELRKWYRDTLSFLRDRHPGEGLGDYLEFGVFRGASLLCMWEALEELRMDDVRIFGFDSFEGLPDSGVAEDRDLPWRPGQYPSDYQETRNRISRAGADPDRVFLVKGWYSDTLTDEFRERLGIRKASVIMIDCDLYSSAKQALAFCAPLIQDEAFIFFDDWDSGVGLADRNLGEKQAFDAFLAEHPHLHAEEFGTYYHTEWASVAPPAKIFHVSKAQPRERGVSPAAHGGRMTAQEAPRRRD
jgi:O-methyltransferase